MTHAEVTQIKKRVEQEYDALITKLNRVQSQLSNKAAQSQRLSLPNYRKWLTKRNDERVNLIAEIQTKKAERADARRKFTACEQGELDEDGTDDWIDWPDCEGWWWFYGSSDGGTRLTLAAYEFYFDANDKPVISTGNNRRDDALASLEWVGKWKFLPEPERP